MTRFIKNRLSFSLVTMALVLLYAGVAYLYAQGDAFQRDRGPITPRDYLYAHCSAPDCDPELLDAIATCESRWIMVQNSSSSAHGYFQILDSTERTTPQYKEGYRKFDPYTNVDMGIYLFEKHGSSPWNESKGCWFWRYQLERATTVPASIGVGV